MQIMPNGIKKALFNEKWSSSCLLPWITVCFVILGSSIIQASDESVVINKETGAVFRDLQLAIDAAQTGDTLEINGPFRGNFIIAKDLTLKGKKHARLNGDQTGSVLSTFTPAGAAQSVTIHLENLSIQNGLAITQGGGGISNINANLIVKSSEILNNSSLLQPGGGISNLTVLAPVLDTTLLAPPPFALGFLASLVLINCQVSNNQTGSSGGGIANFGAMEIECSAITSNIAQEAGGGILSFSGFNIISDTKIAHNAAVLQGGGLENISGSYTILDEVKFIENAAGQGGGLFNGTSTGTGVSAIFINKSEFHGNNTQTAGGGIFNQTGSAVNLNESRIVKNGAGIGGGIFNAPGAFLNLNKTQVKKNVPDDIVEL